MENVTPESEPPAPRLRPESSQNLNDAMKAMSELKIAAQGASSQEDVDEVHSNTTPLVRLANSLIVNAIEAQASELRLDWPGKQAIIRMRVNGVFQELKAGERTSLPAFLYTPLIQRFFRYGGSALLESVSSTAIGRHNRSLQ